MIKLIACFEHEVEGKLCRFLMDQDTAIPVAKEMCFAFLTYLGNVESQVKAQQAEAEAKAASESKSEEIPLIEEAHVE